MITLVSASVVGLISICFVKTLQKDNGKSKNQEQKHETDMNATLLTKSTLKNKTDNSEGQSP